MADRNSGIYKILNKINKKIYIGSAIDFYERWHSHKHYLNKSNHHNEHLQRAWNKYSSDAFEFIIIEHCFRDKLLQREQHWIDVSNCCNPKIGYNIRIVASSNVGLKFSEETKAKMSAWQVGTSLSDETKEKLSIFNMGKKLSNETRLKMRKIDKWPCPDGSKCKCERCKHKRRDLHTEWRYR